MFNGFSQEVFFSASLMWTTWKLGTGVFLVVIYPSGGLLNSVSIQKSKKETFIGQRAGKTPKHIHTFRNFWAFFSKE